MHRHEAEEGCVVRAGQRRIEGNHLDDLEVEGADRRSDESMRSALSSARRAKPEVNQCPILSVDR